ncbi:unnamed protein product [Owenia fusiformis]|uniref:Cryptochrome-1 n=1 Tax=Owenia fusiformis TaxID=6347 RepID=A0A8J1XJ46_OWEFU|nr:unnamed protein product [Owenia fusiformis]
MGRGQSGDDSITKPGCSILWFRHGLRLHDNPALQEAIKDCEKLYPVFIFDGQVAGTSTSGYNRTRFLLECLEDLDRQFKDAGGRLYVLYGKPVDVFREIHQEWGVTKICFEQDPEPIWQNRDALVRDFCKSAGIECVEKIGHTLWNPKDIISENGGMPPLTYEKFNAITSLIGPPPRPTERHSFISVKLPVEPDHDERHSIPSLEKLGKEPELPEQLMRINQWKGGESEARKLFKIRMRDEEEAFKKGFMMPNQFKPNMAAPPTSMAAHLRFGCISVREMYWAIHDTFEKVRKEDSPTQLTGQLVWREFFYTMSVGNKDYDKMAPNPICLDIPWYENKEHLKLWEQGQTGFPFIDACQRQMLQEGWVHHVGRHATSCFLTRGDLWISWEEGLKVYLKYMLDADWSVCAGNWMWVSSSAFEKVLQCPSCLDPVKYGMRMDSKGEFVRRYVPELRDMPLRYLFSPWLSPLNIQKKANCIIGTDYPKPMVNHKEVAAKNADMMLKVKQAHENKVTSICAPSNSDEVRKFMWLPTSQEKGLPSCTADDFCKAVENL